MTDEEKDILYEKVMKGNIDKDILVIEDIVFMPPMNVEYHSQYFYCGLCKSGRSLGQYDYHDTDFKAGDICWLLPDHVQSHNYVSPDYSALSVFIKKSYFNKLLEKGVLGKYRYAFTTPIIHLNSEQFELSLSILRLLGLLADSSLSKREMLIDSLCQIISSIGENYLELNNNNLLKKKKLNEDLFEHFYTEIIKHYRESREISFYAKILCLTPKYFATIIKKTTGIEAKDWINRYVIIEAKWLLLHERQKSVQQIADYLGFTEQASFSRLFKTYEGITPTDFRNNN